MRWRDFINISLFMTSAVLSTTTGVTLAGSSGGSVPITPKIIATDYSVANHWLLIPAALDKAVDVFYLYPKAWRKNNPGDPNICEIDNSSMLIGSKSVFARQVTAFETVVNIFAPYYRQAGAAYTLGLPEAEREKVIAAEPSIDGFAAFDFYIKLKNNGRPFILAGS